MKKLQRNFTNQEQSKRLLRLGVPADSADCYNVQTHTGKIPDDATYKDVWQMSIWRNENGNHIEMYPSWSVGRLIEIYEIVGENAGQCVSTTKGTSRIESLVQLYEENATLLDFLKLEE